jgi:hypothetical protein
MESAEEFIKRHMEFDDGLDEERTIEALQARDAATEAKVREEYAGENERLRDALKEIWTAAKIYYTNAHGKGSTYLKDDELPPIFAKTKAALEGKVSQ